jgi:hypothetical protein
VYKKLFFFFSFRLESAEISFPVKHYESVYDLLTNVPHFGEPYIKEKFISTFSEYINKYEPREKSSKELIHSRIGENSLRIGDNVISHFPNRVYNGLEDLAETFMNPAICSSSRENVSVKDNSDFASSEPVYVYKTSNQIWLGILTLDF